MMIKRTLWPFLCDVFFDIISSNMTDAMSIPQVLHLACRLLDIGRELTCRVNGLAVEINIRGVTQ